jgi:hypothetical protein
MRLLLIATALSSLAVPAAAAQRNFTVTSFEKVRVDGPFKVVLTTGGAPFGRAIGPTSALDQIELDREGETLVVRHKVESWNGRSSADGPVTIALGTHDLRGAWVNGSGSLDIDKVSGPSFDLAVQGAGAASVGAVVVDRLTVSLAGSASATLGGKVLDARISTQGATSVDAARVTAKDAMITADGSGIVSLNVSGDAKIFASGPVAIQLGGHPTCTVRAQGPADVSGCH